MRKTIFAGLTALEPGEPLSTDGFSFQDRNPEVIDRWLEVGARTHRHDAHAPLADPVDAPGASAVPSGGQIPADYTLYIGYTLLDEDGRGETTLSEQAVVTTREPIDPPDDAPDGVFASASGSLPAALYYYAMTFTDEAGGETTIGPYVDVERLQGYDNGEIILDGMGAIASAASAAGWRLYRSKNGADYQYMASGTVDDDEFIDDGTPCVGCTPPPDDNTTHGDNSVIVVVPSGLASAASAASGFRLYSSTDGTFESPSLIADFPLSSAGLSLIITVDEVTDGAPPDISTCAAGAHKIDPDTEMLDFPWKRTVESAGFLPSDSDEGDVRLVLDEFALYGSHGGSDWEALLGGAGGGTLEGKFHFSPDEFVTSGSAYLASGDVVDILVPATQRVRFEIHAIAELKTPSGQVFMGLFMDGNPVEDEVGNPVEAAVGSAGVYTAFGLAESTGVTNFGDLGGTNPNFTLGPAINVFVEAPSIPDFPYDYVFELRFRTDGTLDSEVSVRNRTLTVIPALIA